MFQPNSIKGLLVRRQNQALDNLANQASQKTIYDPDIEQMLETKCAIRCTTYLKEIDMTIREIRQWRKQQKLHLERSLKMNKQLAQALYKSDNNMEDIENQKQIQLNLIKEQQQALRRIVQQQAQQEQQLQQQQKHIESQYDMVTQKLKNMTQDTMQAKNSHKMKDHHEAFIQSLNSMQEIFRKPVPKSQNTKIDKKDLRNELKQIDKQLEQLQKLLE